MLKEISLALIQASTEFLPVSSSGHLAVIGKLIKFNDLGFFLILHIASLLAVIVFVRKELYGLLSFKKEYLSWWKYLVIATIPAAVFGFIFRRTIEESFKSYLSLSIAFLFTGFILYNTRYSQADKKLGSGNSFYIGLFQMLALFPGISRSGMTISSAMFRGIDREKAVKFSFLLSIPLIIGAIILEESKIYISLTTVVAFFVCLMFSLIFLNLVSKIIKQGNFWLFSFYCFLVSILCFLLYILEIKG